MIVNEGLIDVSVGALANASGYAYAEAGISTGIFQEVGTNEASASAEFGVASFDNSGTVTVAAKATANATYLAEFTSEAAAYATVEYGVGQAVYADHASASMVNSGAITVSALANASAVNDYVNAHAVVGGTYEGDSGTAIFQYAYGENEAVVGLENTGAITILADAHATAGADYAYASGYIYTASTNMRMLPTVRPAPR